MITSKEILNNKIDEIYSSIIYGGWFLKTPIKSNMEKTYSPQHITVGFKPTKEELTEMLIYGLKTPERGFDVTGYGCNYNNEGVLVEIPNKVPYFGVTPHITLGTSNGGKPVDTGKLQFYPFEDYSKGWKKRLGVTTIQNEGYPKRVFTEFGLFTTKGLLLKADLQKIFAEYISACKKEAAEQAEIKERESKRLSEELEKRREKLQKEREERSINFQKCLQNGMENIPENTPITIGVICYSQWDGDITNTIEDVIYKNNKFYYNDKVLNPEDIWFYTNMDIYEYPDVKICGWC